MTGPRLAAESTVDTMELALGRDILAVLNRHYPDWAWRVEFPSDAGTGRRAGIVVIRNLDCDGRGKMGMAIKLTALASDPALDLVKMLGGEFLERYKLKRAGFKIEEIDPTAMLLRKPEEGRGIH